MNSFTKKGFVQKIIIVLVFLTLFNFMYPYIPVFADDEEDQSTAEAVGGILLNPLLSLFSSIGEGVISVIQKILGLGQSSYYIDTRENFRSIMSGIFTGLTGGAVAGTAGVIIISLVTGGTMAIPAIAAWATAGAAVATGVGVGIANGIITADQIPDDFYLPNYQISPQEIFSGQIPALDVNFINPHYAENDDGEQISSAAILQPIISKWYVAIRNVVLVALMVVLLYIGIRIVISTTASEKAKYQEHIKNWLIALIILVFMHYIMAFALSITEYITQIMSSNNATIIYPISLDGLGQAESDINNNDVLSEYVQDGNLNWPTNLMGAARLDQQFLDRDSIGNEVFTWNKIGYTIIFLCLVFYTLMFLIIYLKRVIYMAFLTVIAPLVALTYPIDKMGDGSAQAFNMWLKEYLFNLLLQPFHLLLYTMLVSSVIDLAKSNMIYAIVALGFLLQGEKLLRRFFGFEKASTTGTIMGSAVGGAMAMQAVNQIGKLKNLGSGKGSKDKSSSSQGDNGSDSRIRTMDSGTTDELMQNAFGTGARTETDEEVATETPAGAREETDTEAGEETRAGAGARPETEAGQPTETEAGQPTETGGRARAETGEEAGTETPDGAEEEADAGTGTGTDSRTAGRLARLRARGRKVLRSPVGAAGRTVGHYTLKGATGIAKKLPRVALGLTGAAALGTVGVAAGLVSDDYSNVLKWGGAAAGIGGALGNSATNLGEKAISSTSGAVKSVKNNYQENRGYTPEQLRAKQNKALDKEWEKDKKIRKLYQDKYGVEEYKKRMEEAKEYRKYGVTDDKIIMSAMDLRDKDSSIGKQEGIAYAKIASTAKTDKELDDYSKRLKDNGIDDTRIAQIKSNVRKMHEP